MPGDTPMDEAATVAAAPAPAQAAEALESAVAAAARAQSSADIDAQQPAPEEAAADGAPAADKQQQEGQKQAQEHVFNPNKKRKVALFMAYVGHGYQGMQRNPGAKTIEDELFGALHKAGAISDANADEHGFMKLHWMRAARTDKGVSAVGQVVSLKMVLEPPGMLERINAALPDQMCVFGYSRATNGFDSRKHCDKRRYEYVLPEWAFDPRVGLGRSALVAQAAAERQAAAAAGSSAEQQQQEQQEQQPEAAADGSATAAADGGAGPGSEAAAGAANGSVAAEPMDTASAEAAGEQQPAAAAAQDGDAAPPATGAADGAAAAEPAAGAEPAEGGASPAAPAAPSGPFVFDDACVQRMNKILKHYEGTHNFHNFTIRTPATAPNAKRFMLSFRVVPGGGRCQHRTKPHMLGAALAPACQAPRPYHACTCLCHACAHSTPAGWHDCPPLRASCRSCPGVFEIDGQRWVRLVVIGQSFMLHQIRKMVGMAVAVMRGTAPESSLQLALRTSSDLNTPMAPELGLFLDEAYFDGYNKQWGELHGNLSLSPWQAEVDAFKMTKLYPHIAAREAEEGVNASWLLSLNEANYRFSQWEEQVARIRAGGGRRTPSRPGSGAASVIGGMESYGHKRQHCSGGRGGPPHKRGRGSFGGQPGEVLPPRDQRGRGRGGRGGQQADDMAAADYSD